MINKIGTVAVYVDDQEQTLKFWTEQVGFEVKANHPMGPNGSWIEVAPKGAESALVIYPKSMMENWEQQKASIVFLSDDAKKTFEEMSGRGVKFIQEPNEMPWGTFAIFEDLDGNQFLIKG
ncbi:VOC family protein [Tumebacillus lipolyticus]|uniref:VOC family protein n=1 Tax=Tumebacillus lipolyticus TaxID=1280370 RepID=A0ABW4ZVW5_9BACL